MPDIEVDGVRFRFSDHQVFSKYDDWSFYRRHIQHVAGGMKAVDLLVCDDRTSYLIEVKDYRQHRRTKPSAIHDEVARKVLDTLAALLPARCKPAADQEAAVAFRFLQSARMRVVLHLEQPSKHSRLFPRAIDPADVRQKLRQALRAVDAHPIVTERNRTMGVPWTVL